MNLKAILAIAATAFAVNVSAGELYAELTPFASQAVAQPHQTAIAVTGELTPELVVAHGAGERQAVVTPLAQSGFLFEGVDVQALGE